jgi:hypothetical protein
MRTTQTEDYERDETTTRRVEFRVAPRLTTIQAAVNAAIRELTALGYDPDDAGVIINYRAEGGVGVISYEVELTDEHVPQPLPVDEHGFAGILAALPRDWPRQLRDLVANGTQTSGELDDVLKLVDEWVLGAVPRDDQRT